MTEKELMEDWPKKMLPHCKEQWAIDVLKKGPSSWITALAYNQLKNKYRKIVGLTDDEKPEPKQFASY